MYDTIRVCSLTCCTTSGVCCLTLLYYCLLSLLSKKQKGTRTWVCRRHSQGLLRVGRGKPWIGRGRFCGCLHFYDRVLHSRISAHARSWSCLRPRSGHGLGRAGGLRRCAGELFLSCIFHLFFVSSYSHKGPETVVVQYHVM